MITIEEAIEIVRDKCPDELIRTYFEYKDEYRFVHSEKEIDLEDFVGIAVVDKNTGEVHFEGATQIYSKFYPLGEEGEKLAEEYDDAQSKMQPVDLTLEQWKEYQEWMSQFA